MRKFFLRFATVKGLFQYLWRERLWWMLPFVVTLVVVGVLLFLAQSTPAAPFLYTAF